MVMLVLVIACLSGCYQGANYYYLNSEKYTAGDREIAEKIDTIYIDYSSGDVQVIRAASEATAKGDEISDTDEVSKESGTIKITETASKELNEKQKVHTWVDGSALYVKYCAADKGIDLRNLNKKLKIEVPAGLSFEIVDVRVSSANASLNNIESQNISVQASSGNINVLGAAKEVELNASSGKISFEQQGECDTVKMSNSSGGVMASIEKAEQIKIMTSSGDIQVNAGTVTEFESNSSSGACRAKFTEVPQKTKIGASSGSVSVYLPENPDLKAHVTTSSGKFYCDIPLAKDGDGYICGDGSNYIEVTTSSGDVDFFHN